MPQLASRTRNAQVRGWITWQHRLNMRSFTTTSSSASLKQGLDQNISWIWILLPCRSSKASFRPQRSRSCLELTRSEKEMKGGSAGTCKNMQQEQKWMCIHPFAACADLPQDHAAGFGTSFSTCDEGRTRWVKVRSSQPESHSALLRDTGGSLYVHVLLLWQHVGNSTKYMFKAFNIESLNFTVIVLVWCHSSTTVAPSKTRPSRCLFRCYSRSCGNRSCLRANGRLLAEIDGLTSNLFIIILLHIILHMVASFFAYTLHLITFDRIFVTSYYIRLHFFTPHEVLLHLTISPYILLHFVPPLCPHLHFAKSPYLHLITSYYISYVFFQGVFNFTSLKVGSSSALQTSWWEDGARWHCQQGSALQHEPIFGLAYWCIIQFMDPRTSEVISALNMELAFSFYLFGACVIVWQCDPLLGKSDSDRMRTTTISCALKVALESTDADEEHPDKRADWIALNINFPQICRSFVSLRWFSIDEETSTWSITDWLSRNAWRWVALVILA